jgi:thiol:disulfide interchange protein
MDRSCDMNRPSLNWFIECAALLLAGVLPTCFTGCSSPTKSDPGGSLIYDPRADGEQQLKAALAQARRENKRILLDLGANWCSDSQATYRLLRTDPKIRRELEQHFVLVLVDVNQRDGLNRNAKLVARYGNPLARGIPVLLVLSPDGSLLNADSGERLRDDAHQRPEQVLAYLRKWASEEK